MLTMGSLFDGIGGFPLAATHNGIIPLWASEIEKFPMEVTKIRFPEMEHVGDITKLDGAILPVVDIITGGSPCQDLSIAGARAGLKGERSGLFMEQVRIAKEMRKEDAKRGRTTHSIRPRYFVWENVPGAFSSAEGEDFRAVLEEIVKVHDSSLSVPRPDSGKWQSSGGILLGHEFSLAWRVLNAQYWGVPQRRRRIFLVADFGGTTAPQILFKQDCLFGDFTQSQSSWQGTSSTAKASTTDTSRADKSIEPLYCLHDHGGERMDIEVELTPTLRASMANHPPLVPQPMLMASTKPNAEITQGVSPTVTASAGLGGGNAPLLFNNHRRESRYDGPLEISPTLMADMGTGGNNGPIVKQESFCIASNTINREDHNGGNGKGFQSDIAYTLTTSDIHAIYSPKPYQEVVGALMHRDHKGVNTCYVNQDKCIVAPYQEVIGAICATDDKGPNNQYVNSDKCIVDQQQVFGQASYGGYDDNISTLTASGGTNGGGSENLALTRNLVRRLTPLECERLQGFPDGWTNIKGASDSPRYKALGNSVAIPCVDFVMRGIAYFLEKESEEWNEVL